jgi:Secretory lipase
MMSVLHRVTRIQGRKLPTYPRPPDDPFYESPEDEDLASVKPGTLLDWRPIPVRGTHLKVAADGWQIRFRSTDTGGEPISAVATLFVPLTPWPRGPRPLLSYQCAIDSLGASSDPSYTLRRGSQREAFMMALALRRGWAVVTSDFTGPRHAYGAGLIAAWISLDGIRASLAFGPGGLDPTAPVGAWGYSGGGQATAWIAEQQPAYAPEVRLVAMAAGGVPTDRRALRRIDGGFFSGLALGAAVGIDREYPETKLEVILNDEGRRIVNEVGEMSVDELVAYFPFRSLRELTTEPDPFDTEGTRTTNEELRLGQRLPACAVYLYHSRHDQLIPISGADELAAIYRKGGVDVTLRRTHLGEHIGAAVSSTPGALRFLSSRLNA